MKSERSRELYRRGWHPINVKRIVQTTGIFLAAGPVSVNQLHVGKDAIVEGDSSGQLQIDGILDVESTVATELVSVRP